MMKGERIRGMGLGFTNSVECWTCVCVWVAVVWVVYVGSRWGIWLGSRRVRLCYVLCVVPAHIRCTQCLILLHLIHIRFLLCICLWQIFQI